MIQASSRCRGFTFVELAIMIIASGVMIAAGLKIYDAYLQDYYAHDTQKKLTILDSALASFIGANNRLPCPSNPTIPVTDPLAGREIPASSCATLRASSTPVGTCLDGVCKVNGARDTDADGDNNPDPVMVGGYPFVALQSGGATMQNALDAWNYQFTYAVSGYLTTSGTYRSSWGAIDVRTEPTSACPRPGCAASTNPNDPYETTLGGFSLVDPPGSSQYVIIGHGQNHLGAYSSAGVVSFPCTGATFQDVDNCDNNPVTNNMASFTAGIRRDTSVTQGGFTYKKFDDQLKYNSFSLSSLWDFVGSNGDIHNLNPGYVGMGTSNPTQQLELVGDLKAVNLITKNLCDQASGAECWSPDLLSAPAASGKSLFCPNTNTPGFNDVLTGITNGASGPQAVCAKVPKVVIAPGTACGMDTSVTPNQQTYVAGFKPDGTPICYTPASSLP